MPAKEERVEEAKELLERERESMDGNALLAELGALYEKLSTRYPSVWNGLMTLKNDAVFMALHFLEGNEELYKLTLNPTSALRIAQRMRLETTQLDAVRKRMLQRQDYCVLLGLPAPSADPQVQLRTAQTLQQQIISYLLQKQAAGIINVPLPSAINFSQQTAMEPMQLSLEQTAYVIHIFPPCEFSFCVLRHSLSDQLADQLLSRPFAGNGTGSLGLADAHLLVLITNVQ